MTGIEMKPDDQKGPTEDGPKGLADGEIDLWEIC